MAAGTVVLHVGTHKTGTTTLQTMLARNPEWFERQGVDYPVIGRQGDGHHNLAWQLNGDERFEPAAGTMADLSEDLRRRRPPAVLLSSEDFEYLHAQPDALARLRSALEMAGYQVRVVVALRDPADYLESLYAELAGHHGLDRTLGEVVAEVLATGQLSYGRWVFALDYRRLVEALAGSFGKRQVRVLRYQPGDAVRPVLDTWEALTGVPVTEVADWQRFNVRASPAGAGRVTLEPVDRQRIEQALGGAVDPLVRRFGQPGGRLNGWRVAGWRRD